MIKLGVFAVLVAVIAIVLAAHYSDRASSNDASRGRALIAAVGCGACHTIPGVEGADGAVGPSLAGLGGRRSIAGRLPNTPDNLALWIQGPQEVDPGNLMPDLGLSRTEATEIASYLEHQ
jgi:cytochrome c2